MYIFAGKAWAVQTLASVVWTLFTYKAKGVDPLLSNVMARCIQPPEEKVCLAEAALELVQSVPLYASTTNVWAVSSKYTLKWFAVWNIYRSPPAAAAAKEGENHNDMVPSSASMLFAVRYANDSASVPVPTVYPLPPGAMPEESCTKENEGMLSVASLYVGSWPRVPVRDLESNMGRNTMSSATLEATANAASAKLTAPELTLRAKPVPVFDISTRFPAVFCVMVRPLLKLVVPLNVTLSCKATVPKNVDVAFTCKMSLDMEPNTVLLPEEKVRATERSSATPNDAKDPAPWNTLEPW